MIVMSETAAKRCPSCACDMELAVEDYPVGSAFVHNRFHVDIYRCPKCSRVEMYASDKQELVTCPVCGATHSAHEKCPICALNTAFSDHSRD